VAHGNEVLPVTAQERLALFKRAFEARDISLIPMAERGRFVQLLEAIGEDLRNYLKEVNIT
jgi:hypothetical protein